MLNTVVPEHAAVVYNPKLNDDSQYGRRQLLSGCQTFTGISEPLGLDFCQDGAQLELAPTIPDGNSNSTSSSPSSYQIIFTDWPDKLPQPDLLRHL